MVGIDKTSLSISENSYSIDCTKRSPFHKIKTRPTLNVTEIFLFPGPLYYFRFRSLHSTVTDLLEAVDNWAFNIDRGNVNAVVFLDLKRHLTPLIMISFYLK